jgi:hypothetical protein
MQGDEIRVGGMLRCCVATINADTTPAYEGYVLECVNTKKCGARMKYTGGVWYWHPR